MPKVSFYRVDMERAGQRIDNFLIGYWKRVPKSRVYRVLRKGEVRVNGRRVKPDYRLVEADEIRIPPVRLPDRPVNPAAPSQSLRNQLERALLYEDEAMMAFNKPTGLAVHGGTGVDLGLVEALRYMRPELTGLELVHRLDKDTSGVVLLAKQRPALNALQQAFRERNRVDKRYWCLVSGHWPEECAEVNAPLLKHEAEGGERRVTVREDGKSAQTRYRTLEAYRRCTLIEACPVTGRTHQIRVHCQYAGHPILGDGKYQDGSAKQLTRQLGLKRLFLHAARLSVPHPETGDIVTLEAPLEKSLTHVLQGLKT